MQDVHHLPLAAGEGGRRGFGIWLVGHQRRGHEGHHLLEMGICWPVLKNQLC
jgi:hypothetical protein